jgi:excisionase family DNA binding protein
MEQLLSVEQAAQRLGGISKWTVHAWLSKGKLLRTKVGGRTMIRESELRKVVQDGGKSPAPHATKRRKNQPAKRRTEDTTNQQRDSSEGLRNKAK